MAYYLRKEKKKKGIYLQMYESQPKRFYTKTPDSAIFDVENCHYTPFSNH